MLSDVFELITILFVRQIVYHLFVPLRDRGLIPSFYTILWQKTSDKSDKLWQYFVLSVSDIPGDTPPTIRGTIIEYLLEVEWNPSNASIRKIIIVYYQKSISRIIHA